MAWANGRLEAVELVSQTDQLIQVRNRDVNRSLSVKAGVALSMSAEDFANRTQDGGSCVYNDPELH